MKGPINDNPRSPSWHISQQSAEREEGRILLNQSPLAVFSSCRRWIRLSVAEEGKYNWLVLAKATFAAPPVQVWLQGSRLKPWGLDPNSPVISGNEASPSSQRCECSSAAQPGQFSLIQPPKSKLVSVCRQFGLSWHLGQASPLPPT